MPTRQDGVENLDKVFCFFYRIFLGPDASTFIADRISELRIAFLYGKRTFQWGAGSTKVARPLDTCLAITFMVSCIHTFKAQLHSITGDMSAAPAVAHCFNSRPGEHQLP